MPPPSAGARFRALHARPHLFVMPTPWDVGTARVVAAAGFEAVATASAAIACTVGRPDGQLDRQTALEHARVLLGATDLPVNADLENGYGRAPEAVAATIERAIATGLAGCSIEDLEDGALYDTELAIERIAAAAQTRDALDAAFVLTARCEAFLTDVARPLDLCIERLARMAAAGADVVYACGMHRAADIEALVAASAVPVNVLGGTGPEPLSLAALEDLGIRRVSLGPRLMQAAMAGFRAAVDEIADNGTFTFMRAATSLAPFQGR